MEQGASGNTVVLSEACLEDLGALLRSVSEQHASEQSRQLDMANQRHLQCMKEELQAFVRRFHVAAPPLWDDVGPPVPDAEPDLLPCPSRKSSGSSPRVSQAEVRSSVFSLNRVHSETHSVLSPTLERATSDVSSTQSKAKRLFQRYTEGGISQRMQRCSKVLSWLTARRMKCDALLTVVTGHYFTSVIAMLIMINAVTICVNTDYEMKVALKEQTQSGTSDRMMDDIFWNTDFCFTIVFALELMLRLLAYEFTFFTVPEHKWNVLDFAIVAVSIVEAVFVSLGVELSYIRVLRLFRIFRTLRVVRTVSLFVKLRTMINAIANSVFSLMWALSLVMFTMLMFSAVFLQGATAYISSNIESTDPLYLQNVSYLEEFFHSLPMAVLTLFMAITGGVNWWDAERVLLDIGFQYGLLFLLYIATMFLALLNIVTGLFVNDAVEMSQMDRDIVMRFQEDKRVQCEQCLRNLFIELDANDSRTVTLDEFQAHLNQNGPGVFSYLGLEVWDAVNLFEALDIDGSRQLDIEEFVQGCMQLRGQAKTVDMVTLMRENERIMRSISKASLDTFTHIERLEQYLIQRTPIDRDEPYEEVGSSDPVKRVWVDGKQNYVV